MGSEPDLATLGTLFFSRTGGSCSVGSFGGEKSVRPPPTAIKHTPYAKGTLPRCRSASVSGRQIAAYADRTPPFQGGDTGSNPVGDIRPKRPFCLVFKCFRRVPSLVGCRQLPPQNAPFPGKRARRWERADQARPASWPPCGSGRPVENREEVVWGACPGHGCLSPPLPPLLHQTFRAPPDDSSSRRDRSSQTPCT